MIKYFNKNIHVYEFPECLIFADVTKKKDGDYMEVARIVYRTGEVIYKNKYELDKPAYDRISKATREIENRNRKEIETNPERLYFHNGYDCRVYKILAVSHNYYKAYIIETTTGEILSVSLAQFLSEYHTAEN